MFAEKLAFFQTYDGVGLVSQYDKWAREHVGSIIRRQSHVTSDPRGQFFYTLFVFYAEREETEQAGR
jgi:hypothetical protein